MKITKFEDLKIWQLSLSLTKKIYDITSQKEFARDFGLRDQIRRASVSISSNIVEGFEKNNNNEFVRLLRITKGSIGEVRNQLYIAFAIKYINQKQFDDLNESFNNLASQAGKLISYLESQKRTRKLANN